MTVWKWCAFISTFVWVRFVVVMHAPVGQFLAIARARFGVSKHILIDMNGIIVWRFNYTMFSIAEPIIGTKNYLRIQTRLKSHCWGRFFCSNDDNQSTHKFPNSHTK